MTVSVLLLFLTVPWDGLQCLVVVISDHTHLLFANFLLGNFWLETRNLRLNDLSIKETV